ncbi:MAG: Bax inhibitor-1 family protein [Fibromonadales bacterium]|nr:Bax inhibitor-1 family protein [Fibromonadales bacterium]
MQDATYVSPFQRVENAPSVEQANFYRKTYLTTGFSFLIWMMTVFGMFQTGIAYSLINAITSVSWLVVLAIFWGASFLGGKLTFAEEKEKQYLGLGIYILAYSLIFTPLIGIVIDYSGGVQMAMDNVLIPAFIATCTIFAALTVTVFVTKTDFSFLRSVVVFGSFIALGAIVIFTITGAAVGTWFAIAMIILMSAAILYETHRIKENFNTNQHIGAGAVLFASFMTLLWYVISLFMRRD